MLSRKGAGSGMKTTQRTSRCFHIASAQASRGSNAILFEKNAIQFNRLLARPERFERPTLRFVVWW
jgi:hypothetical protein